MKQMIDNKKPRSGDLFVEMKQIISKQKPHCGDLFVGNETND
jgi:hypothetical protein